MTRTPADAREALRVLESLGASPWLVRHHELVVEAAEIICDRFADGLHVSFDRADVLIGAALHDAGKILHPHEMTRAGHDHEVAGRLLLQEHGVSDRISRFCVTHASWAADDITIEDLLVALADKLWKGKRDEELERILVYRVAALRHIEPWQVFDRFDAMCEEVAADGPSRLARSQI